MTPGGVHEGEALSSTGLRSTLRPERLLAVCFRVSPVFVKGRVRLKRCWRAISNKEYVTREGGKELDRWIPVAVSWKGWEEGGIVGVGVRRKRRVLMMVREQ